MAEPVGLGVADRLDGDLCPVDGFEPVEQLSVQIPELAVHADGDDRLVLAEEIQAGGGVAHLLALELLANDSDRHAGHAAALPSRCGPRPTRTAGGPADDSSTGAQPSPP